MENKEELETLVNRWNTKFYKEGHCLGKWCWTNPTSLLMNARMSAIGMGAKDDKINTLLDSVELSGSLLSTRGVTKELSYMEKEIWKDVSGWIGLYKVSNLGRVKSLKRPEKSILTPVVESMGYHVVRFYYKGNFARPRIHRLVANAFLDNPLNKPFVNHKDGHKTNNKVSNLEWCTAKENSIHAYKKGLSKGTFQLGEKSLNAKMTENKVKKIRKEYKIRKTSCVKLGEKYGLSAGSIWQILKRQTWNHVK